MKKSIKILILLLALCLCMAGLIACEKDKCADGHIFNKENVCTVCGKNGCDLDKHDYVNGVCKFCDKEYPYEDFVAQCKLDMNSNTAKYTNGNIIRMYIDGDTTHFNVPVSTAHPEGVLKARYLAVNTPESTGQIEPYGKLASNYTHETLQKAIDNGGAVLVESDTDDGIWNTDSYGRTLAWVWYRPSANAEWRNLNLELLQEGYGYGSNPSQNRYGEYCTHALNQALQAKLIVHSKLKDPNFYYGTAYEIDLKELRTNTEKYDGVKVAFEGYVTDRYDGSSYIQWYCEEDGIYYGISVYYNSSDSDLLAALKAGSHVRVVGKASSFNGTWQVSSITNNPLDPDDPDNTILLDPNCNIDIAEMTIPQFNAEMTVEVYDHESKERIEKGFIACQLTLDTAVSMKNLIVDHAYTTPSGTSKGAMSLYCKDADDNEITVRTEKLYKKVDGQMVLVEQSEFVGKTINVVGVVDYYNFNGRNEYQIRVTNYASIVIVEEA